MAGKFKTTISYKSIAAKTSIVEIEYDDFLYEIEIRKNLWSATWMRENVFPEAGDLDAEGNPKKGRPFNDYAVDLIADWNLTYNPLVVKKDGDGNEVKDEEGNLVYEESEEQLPLPINTQVLDGLPTTFNLLIMEKIFEVSSNPTRTPSGEMPPEDTSEVKPTPARTMISS